MKNGGINALPKVEGYIASLTINLVVLGLLNAALGFFVSYGIGLLFPDFTDEWKKEPAWIQWSDVIAEISLLVIAAFWVMYLVRFIIPVVPLKPSLEFPDDSEQLTDRVVTPSARHHRSRCGLGHEERVVRVVEWREQERKEGPHRGPRRVVRQLGRADPVQDYPHEHKNQDEDRVCPRHPRGKQRRRAHCPERSINRRGRRNLVRGRRRSGS